MATVDTRSGFRLPWSSDRSHEDPDRADPADAALEAAIEQDDAGASTWPPTDIEARTSPATAAVRPAEEPVMTQLVATPTLAPRVARKPTKLMADLATAIRATTEAARDQALAWAAADAAQVTEAIRAAATEGALAIRRQSEADLASIKEWSKAEIARVREQTDARTEARKATLESELSSHAAAVDHRVGEVDGAIARYRADMETYFESLAGEDDPARLATMAEAMPEPPALDALVNLRDMDVSAFAPATIAEPEASAADAATAEFDAVPGSDEPPVADTRAGAAVAWGMSDQAWRTRAVVRSDEPDAGDAPDDASNPAADEAPDAYPDTADGGNPVDRDALMATIEAAAEAVVTAEAIAQTADEEGAAAQTAPSARVDAGGLEAQSFTDRLASLMPGHGGGATDGEPRTSQVIVTGLVSVASIASFKRHLGRLTGVQSVAVSSGPAGEFVFNVNHRADVSFRDAIPSMPGFAARVTGATDGVVSVTARDPEAEG
jgi:hypothetical protein